MSLRKSSFFVIFAVTLALLLSFTSVAFAETPEEMNDEDQIEISLFAISEEGQQEDSLEGLSIASAEEESLLTTQEDTFLEVQSDTPQVRETVNFSADTPYYIMPVANTDYVLDAAGQYPRVGSNVSVWTRNGGSNQMWYFVLGEDGYYTIQCAADRGLILDAAARNPRVGSNVSTWSNNDGLNQRWIIEYQNGVYLIKSAANSDLVLDAAGVAPRKGANVSVWRTNGGPNQQWFIKSYADVYAELDALAAVHAGAVSDGTYTIFDPSIAGSPVVDVRDNATYAGANVQSNASNASSGQVWEVSHNGNFVVFENPNSGKFLTVEGGNNVSGANVVLGDNSNDRAAWWICIWNNDGTCQIRSAVFNNISLDITGGRSAAGTNIETWTSNGSAAQRFAFVTTPANVGTCADMIDTSKYYYIKSALNSGLFLDVTGASLADGANIELWTGSGLPWQTFRFEYVGGYYRIVNAHGDKVLTVANNSLVPGSNVVNYSSIGAISQLWQAIQNSDGTYSFINRLNGFALQAATTGVGAGTNINTSWRSDSGAQKFFLQVLDYVMPTGIFNLSTALNSGRLLDVNGASKAEGANVLLWNNKGGNNQKWSIQSVAGKNHTYLLKSICSGLYLTDDGSGNAIQLASGNSESAQWVASLIGGSYVLTNVATGRALDVTNGNSAAGNNVGTAPVTNQPNQRWNLVSTAPLQNGTYIIRSKNDTGKVMDVVGRSFANNANVDMWDFNGGNNQKFNFTRNGDGTYTITNCNSDKVLDAARASSAIGTNIAQYGNNGQANQHWVLQYNNDGSFALVSAMNGAVALGFSGETPLNGTNVCLVANDGSGSSQFIMEQTTYVPSMSWDKRDMVNRAQGYSSGTGYLILVDRSTHKVGIFSGWQGNWACIDYFSCVTGAPWSQTITGTYRTTGGKAMALTTDSRAKWCTQINGGYFFHTILASEGELGQSLSHGCVRLAYPKAQWIYHNIGRGTTVSIYN